MFILRSTKDDRVHYIRKKNTSIGRQAGDIILKDNGVSRSHAELKAEGDKLYIISLKEHLRTLINNVPVLHNVKNNLKVGDIVQFGMSFEFSVENVQFRVATSSLPENEKSELELYLRQMGTKLLASFRQGCTHLVVPELCPSVKVICAVILNIPMVTLDFFKVLCDATTNEFPKEADFRPVIKPSIHEVKNSYFEYNEKRRTLFEGKTFVFFDEKSGKPMKTMISLAGGEYSPFDPSLISEYKRTSRHSKYIIIQCDCIESLAVSKSVKTAYREVCTALATGQWRTVPMQEIAFALIKCSCDVDCNPAFNRGKNLLKIVDSQDSPNRRAPLAHSTQVMKHILTKDTESQNNSHFGKDTDEMVILPTYENELDEFNVEKEWSSKQTPSSQALARRTRVETVQNIAKDIEVVCKKKDNAAKTIQTLTQDEMGVSMNPFEQDINVLAQVRKRTDQSKNSSTTIPATVIQNSEKSAASQANSSQFLGQNLIGTQAERVGKSDSSILQVVKRKPEPLESPINKKIASEEIVSSLPQTLSGGQSSSGLWFRKCTQADSFSQNKRKYDEDLPKRQDENDLGLPRPIKIEPIEHCSKRQKHGDLLFTGKSDNVFESPNSDDIFETDSKEELQTLTQTFATYFESRIKEESVIDENATLVCEWISCRPRVEKLEIKEAKLDIDNRMKEYAEKYFSNFEEKFRCLDILSEQRNENDSNVNYKKFRKTRHIPVTLKNTFMHGVTI